MIIGSDKKGLYVRVDDKKVYIQPTTNKNTAIYMVESLILGIITGIAAYSWLMCWW